MRQLPSSTPHQMAISCLFLALLLLTTFIYWPGLNGLFIFDDYPNLERLAELSTANNDSQWLIYIGTGNAGALGRPISLATFALQHYAWPHSPEAFKYANLLIHLLNGCLIFVVSRRLVASQTPSEKSQLGLAVAVTAIWLLHPLHVSTVLFVVQRMTQLSSLFVLLGIALYLKGRQGFLTRSSWPRMYAYGWMSAGVILGMLLGTLSKETGVLLPLLILTLEFTLLRTSERPGGFRLWASLFLVLPLAVLIGYFALRYQSFFIDGYSSRDFNLGERLLTQARVLMGYLGKLLVPTPSSLHLFNDDYLPSRSLLDPIQTAPAVATVLMGLGLAVALRRRAPIFSFGVLWFLAAHILESSVFALELVFDHRNYLPSIGILLSTIWLVTLGIRRLGSTFIRGIVLASVALFLLMLGGITANQTRLWGAPLEQAMVWAAEKPGSLRARQWESSVLAMSGHHAEAHQRMATIAAETPDDASSTVNLLKFRCFAPDSRPSQEEIASLQHRMSDAAISNGVIRGLNETINLIVDDKCPHLDPVLITTSLHALLDNPNYRPHFGSLHFLLGKTYAGTDRADEAVHHMNLAFETTNRYEIALILAGWMADSGHYEDAMKYVNQAKSAISRNPFLYFGLKDTFNDWEEMLREKSSHSKESEQTDPTQS